MYPRAFKLNENVLKRVLLVVLLPYETVVRSAVRPVVDAKVQWSEELMKYCKSV